MSHVCIALIRAGTKRIKTVVKAETVDECKKLAMSKVMSMFTKDERKALGKFVIEKIQIEEE